MATTVGTLMIDMAANISRLQSDMQQARSVVTGAAGDMQKTANLARDAIGALGIGFSVAGAVAAMQQIGKALIDAEASAVKFKAAFTSIAGADSVGREMEFVRSTARSLGLDLEQVSSSYIKLSAASRGTSLQGEQTREIFTAVSKAATTLGLSSSEADGALLAVSQMMSKGTVQAEELRGQLGERLPGAFQIAARAMGVSTSELGKMLEAGQVIAEDFLPKFAKQLEKELGQASADAAGTAAREMNRLKNEFGDLVKTVADGGSANAIGGFFGLMAQGLAGVTEKMKLMRAEANADGGGFLSWLMGGGLTGQAFRALQGAGGTAQQRLDDANKTLSSGKAGFYAQGQAAAERDRALADLNRLRNLTAQPGGAQEGDDSARNAALDVELKKVEALRTEYLKFAQESSGQHKDYQKNLTMLQAARAVNIIGETEYVAQVTALITAQGGVKKATAERTKAETEAERQAKKLNEAYFDALGISKDYVTKVREFETLLKTKQITTEQYAAAIKNLAADQQVSKDAVKAQKEETDKLKEAEKERMAVLAELSKMRNAESAALTAQQSEADKALQTSKDETAQIGLSKEALGNLTAKRWDEKAALIEQRIDQLAMVGGLGEEYDALVKLTQTYRQNADEIRKGARLTAIQDEATKAKEAWDKQATDIGNSLTDALMRGFESGKDFGKNMADTLKNLFKTLILKPIIQPIAQNAAGSLMSLLGLGTAGTAGATTGAAAGGGSSTAGGASLLGNAGSIAGLFGAGGAGGALMAGAGWLTGATTLTGSLTAAGSLIGTGTLGGTMSGLAMGAGALAPFVLGALALNSIFGKKRGGPKLGGSFSTTGERLFTPAGADTEAGQLGQSALGSISELAGMLGGSSAGLSLGLGFDSDPQGTAGNRIASFLRDSTGRSIYDNTAGRDIGRDDAALQAGLGDETAKLILAGLKASNLPASVRDFIAGVDLATVTSASMDSIIQQARDIVAAEAAWQPLLTDAQIAERNAMGPGRGSVTANALDGFTSLTGYDPRTLTGGDGPPTSLDGFTALTGYDPALIGLPDGVGPVMARLVDKREPRKVGEDREVSSLVEASSSTATSTATISRSQETLLDVAREQRTAQIRTTEILLAQLEQGKQAFTRLIEEAHKTAMYTARSLDLQLEASGAPPFVRVI